MIGGGTNEPTPETVTSMNDTNNNTWTQAGSSFIDLNNDLVQTYYAGNAASSNNLGLTVNWSGSSGDFTILLYDVTGAATSPLDNNEWSERGASFDQRHAYSSIHVHASAVRRPDLHRYYVGLQYRYGAKLQCRDWVLRCEHDFRPVPERT